MNNTTGSGTGTGPGRRRPGILFGNGTIAPVAGNGVTIDGPAPRSGILVRRSRVGTPGNLKVGDGGREQPLYAQPGGDPRFRLNGDDVQPERREHQLRPPHGQGTGAVTLRTAQPDGRSRQTDSRRSSSDVFGILDNQTANGDHAGYDSRADPNPPARDREGGMVMLRQHARRHIPRQLLRQHHRYGDLITGGNDIVLYNFHSGAGAGVNPGGRRGCSRRLRTASTRSLEGRRACMTFAAPEWCNGGALHDFKPTAKPRIIKTTQPQVPVEICTSRK